LIFTLLYSVFTYAVVDMKNANFADTWEDLIVPGTGFDLKVRRTYNSRSLFNGMFGFGWCSDFETSLSFSDKGFIKLTECGGGLEVMFTPKLGQQPESRNLALMKPGTTFFAFGSGLENIEYKGEFYQRNLVDGSTQRYDKEGRLIQMADKNGNFLKLIQSARGVTEIVDNNGRKLSFAYNENKKIKKISGPNGLEAEYKFAGEDLIEIKNAWTNTYSYKYDDLHNLTQIGFPDKTSKKISYNTDKDWVTSFTNRKGCLEKYDYKLFGEKKDHYKSDVVKTCEKEVTNKSSYEFWYKTRGDGSKFLSRVATNNNGDLTDMEYHEVFGRPTSVTKNGQKVLYEYFPNGQVQQQVTTDKVVKFVYDKDKNHLNEVTTSMFSADKKKKRIFKTNFKYDPKGNLAEANDTLGRSVKLTYDGKGRISKIEDQAKKVIKIGYEERFGKPSTVESHGVGSINVSYKSNGEIEKVNSKEGPVVAVQVAATFNNLLEIIAPANTQLKL